MSVEVEYDPESIESKMAVVLLIITLYLYPLLLAGALVWGLIKAWPLIKEFFMWLG